MRWLLIISFLLIASPAFAQENEAEKIFRAMEKKILEAKSLKIEFKGEAQAENNAVRPPKKFTTTFKGNLMLSSGNKARLGLDGETFRADKKGDEKYSAILISDGKNIHSRRSGAAMQEFQKVPERLNQLYQNLSLKLGVFFVATFAPYDPNWAKIDSNKISASDFKLGPMETIGASRAQVIELTVSNAEVTFLVKLWLDPTTSLPLKRRMEAAPNAKPEIGQESFTETYTEFILNLQLDPKLFELPK